MNCENFHDQVGLYIDDSLPVESRRRVEAHMLGCRDCAWEAQSLQITRNRLREDIGEVVASDSFRARTLARLHAANPHINVPDSGVNQPTQFSLQIPLI